MISVAFSRFAHRKSGWTQPADFARLFLPFPRQRVTSRSTWISSPVHDHSALAKTCVIITTGINR